MSSDDHPEDGFTIVEVLVSLAILALMLTYTIQSFFYFNQVKVQIGRMTAQAEVSAATNHLREAIAGIVPVFRQDDQGRSQLHFKGERDAIEFVIMSPGDRETGGLMLVKYHVDDQSRFVSERRVLRNDALPDSVIVVLLQHIEAVGFHYSAGDRYVNNWADLDDLPQLISLELQFRDASGNVSTKVEVIVATAR